MNSRWSVRRLTARWLDGMFEGGRVPYFALFYDVVDDFIERRTPHRPIHLQAVRDAYASGELVLAGALQEPLGALLVFRAADRSVAERFASTDPYVKSGLVTGWRVRPWAVVTGDEA